MNSLLQLLFPAHCFHCEARLEKFKDQLCASCSAHLTLADPTGRCYKCFCEINKIQGVCHACRQRPHALRSAAACFERASPAASIYRTFKRGRLNLARDLAAFFVLQFEKLHWPQADLIVPLPLAWEERLFQNVDASALLAKELGKWIDCPVHKVLKKSGRVEMRKKMEVSDRVVLLVGDSLEQMEKSAEAIQVGAPAEIYGLALLDQ